jgi:hypothetical protein
MVRRVLVLATAWLAAASTSLAQQREPIARFVVDVRGASAGLPTAEGWTPVVPAGTVAPSRSLGFEAGAHLHILRFRGGALGLGATWLMARGTISGPEIPAGVAAPLPLIPDLTTRLSSVAPQLSLNFGHSLGWSYLSAGLGQTKVESEAVSGSSAISFTPRNSGWVKTLNYGGGARWFLTDHLGVGFDLRWHKLSLIGATATSPGAPRASLVTAGVGIALK